MKNIYISTFPDNFIKIGAMESKKSQITIFVIIAIVLVIGIIIFFTFKSNLLGEEVSKDLQPAYDYYLSCIENSVKKGTVLLGTQAGYLEDSIALEQGSYRFPSSSHLEFMGFSVPYWYYISSNGLIKQNVPLKKDLERNLNRFVKEDIMNCDFSGFAKQGFIIQLGEANVKTIILDNKIEVLVNQQLKLEFNQSKLSKKKHNLEVDSQFGNLYDNAKIIFEQQNKLMFLENYTTDVLNLYAPVTGVEISCSPLTWNPYEVISDLKNALEINLASIKLNSLKSSDNDYFSVKLEKAIDLKNANVNILYSPDWPSRFEVWPTTNNIMIANPIGNQQGLDSLGFCYVPYKFAYDLYFPVLIQLYNPNSNEIFQFPFAIYIEKNLPRQASFLEDIEIQENPEICENANSEIEIYTYGPDLNPISADVQFKCLNTICPLGKTKIDSKSQEAVLKTQVPQCVNAVLTASIEGYSSKKEYVSTNEENVAFIVLGKEYELPVEVYVDNQKTDNMAIITFRDSENLDEVLQTISYPENNLILTPGDYLIDIKIYEQSTIILPPSSTTQCIENQCFDLTIPEQTISNVLYAGGSIQKKISGEELSSGTLKIYTTSLPKPKTPEDIQQAYDIIDVRSIRVELK